MALWLQKGLLAKVKSDYENLFSPDQRELMRGPNLTGAFEWLAYSWKRARRPKGRPFEAWRYFTLVNLMAIISELKKTDKKGQNPKILEALEYLEGEVLSESYSWKNWKYKSVARRKNRIKRWARKYQRDPQFRLRGGRIEGY